MTKSKTTEGIVIAAALIVLSLVLAWAGRTGLIGADQPTRITMALYGLFIAYYGNSIPKVLMRSERAITARRFAGWAMVLAGLATTGIWIFVTTDEAASLTIFVVGGAVLLVAMICLLSRSARA